MGHFYVAPSGAERSNFPLAELEALIAHGDQSYWSTGSGGGLLYQGQEEEGPNVEIYFVPPDGFHITFDAPDQPQVAAESRNPAATRGWAEIGVGGDAFNIHRRQIVSREEAVAIVRHLAEQGAAAPEVDWARPRSYDPSRDGDDL